jgi:mannose-1-phosphate guanylyltransferase
MAASDWPVYPVLLAGGSGTRLWPVSRELFPKQLARLIGGESLIQSTLRRLVPPFAPENVRVVCGAQHAHEISRHMEGIGMPSAGKVITEPAARNTAPAILLACLQVLRTVEDAVLGIFPADHVIGDIPRFHEKLAVAMELAGQGPKPDTGTWRREMIQVRLPSAGSWKNPILRPPAATLPPVIFFGTVGCSRFGPP